MWVPSYQKPPVEGSPYVFHVCLEMCLARFQVIFHLIPASVRRSFSASVFSLILSISCFLFLSLHPVWASGSLTPEFQIESIISKHPIP